MKIYLKIIYLFAVLFFANVVVAQSDQLSIAQEKFNNYSYIDAIKIYERMAEKGYKQPDVLKKLGDCYYFNADYTKAAVWYGRLFSIDAKQESEYIYRYAQSLKSAGNTAKAKEYLAAFVQASDSEIRSNLLKNNMNYLDIIKQNSQRYQIKNLDINSNLSDFGSSVFNSKLYFSSSRTFGSKTKKISNWDNNPFTSIFYSEINGQSNMSQPQLFNGGDSGSNYNESTPVFSKDGQTMYFTSNDVSKLNKDNKATAIVVNLKIYKRVLKNSKWSAPIELPFCSANYNVAHPALSPDEKYLYFVSNMPGTLGDSDIFFVEINSDGSYSTPKNMGSSVNTEGKESYPFISADNELYFASNGHPGLGGLDIFVCKISSENKVFKVSNVGEPVNGVFDDFAFYMNFSSKNGFFSSNRPEGKGLDDIYSIFETRRINEFILDGVVEDKITHMPIAEAKVTVLDENFAVISEVVADNNGRYNVPLLYGTKYYVKAEKDGYLTAEKPFMSNSMSTDKVGFKLELEKRILPVKTGDDLAKLFDVGVLHFDFDSAVINYKASLQLEKIYELLNVYSTIMIEIRTHTDSRGSTVFNDKLSDLRFKSITAWLTKKGIKANRLSGKGYGESRLINECKDGVECSDKQHEENRRCEFIFIK
jgi:outer membrane protein OmpA-like peptidoglycan-associated protein/tetratricopeptide (TPR) repeat protein